MPPRQAFLQTYAAYTREGPCSGIVRDPSELRQALEYAQQLAEPWG